MKLFQLLLTLLFLLHLHSAFAQEKCDTLILYPDRELIVDVDRVYDNTLYARLCEGASDRVQAIPLKMIKAVKGSELSSLIINKRKDKPESIRDIETTSAPKNISSDRQSKPSGNQMVWLFTQRSNKSKQVALEAGTKVEISAQDQGKRRSYRGHFRGLTPTHLILESEEGVFELPKGSVSSITIKGKNKKSGLVGGAIGLGLGLIIGLLSGIREVGEGLDNLWSGSSGDGRSSAGCLVGPILIIGGIIFMIVGIPESIKNPFTKDWEITQVAESTEDEKEP